MSRKFKMIRVNDQGGVSGTGHILDGIEFDNGKVCGHLVWESGHSSECSYI